MREVDVETFAKAHAAGAALVDVREPFEYRSGHVPGAMLVPLGQLASRATELPPNGPVYIICATGNRSLVAAEALTRAGFDAYSVAGGMAAWRRTRRDVKTGRRER